MQTNATTDRMKLPYKIEIECEGRWVQLAEDNDQEAATEVLNFLETYLSQFAEDLRKCGWSGPAVGALRVRTDEGRGQPEDDADDSGWAIRQLREANQKASALRKSATADLERVAPLLTETLRDRWDTGQGTRARQLLWSLYNGSGLVALGYTCSGFDPELAEALAAAIRARLALGADVEDALKKILTDGGEFARFNAAADRTPEPHVVVYPPMPVSGETLRDLADSLEATAKS